MSARQFSGDRKWWWTGSQWVAAVSADGKWRWDGTKWQPTEPAEAMADSTEPSPPAEQAPNPVPTAAQTLPEQAPPVTATPPPPTASARRGAPAWLVAITCLLCFPIGLVLTWLSNWSQRTKVIVSAATVIVWGAVGISVATAPQQPTGSPAGNVALAPSPRATSNAAPSAAHSASPAAHSPSPAAHSPTPSQTSTSAPQATDHRVLSVTGTGYETTQPFKIPSSEWTVTWTVTGDPQFATATFVIHSSDGSVVDSIDASPGSDSSTVHQGNDVFFIDILVANARYTVTASARYAGPDQAFPIPAMTNLAVYSGGGDKSTPTFHVSGSVWVVVLQTGPPSQYTSVSAFIYKSDGSDVSELSVEGAQGGQQTISYVYAGPGDYYLKILDANTTWTATIEQTAS